MKNTMKRVVSALLCLLLLSSLSVLAFAAEEDAFLDFQKSQDESRISTQDATYYSYDLPMTIFLMADVYYHYKDTLYLRETERNIESPYSYREIIFVGTEETGYSTFATERGSAYLDAFFTRQSNVGDYVLYTENAQIGLVSKGFFERVQALVSDADAVRKSFSGATLEGSEYSELGTRDTYHSVMARYGVIFTLSDGYYYLDRATTPGEELSDVYTASQPTELVKLDEALADEYNEALRGARFYHSEHIYEGEEDELLSDEDYDVKMERGILVIFWIAFAVLGFVIPCVGLVFGLVLPRSKKLKGQKHWYALAILCGVWILTALAMMILVLVV